MASETLHFENARFAQQLFNNEPRNLQSLEEQLGVKATSREDWQTFSHLAFAFRVTPALLAGGVVFALLMGIIGGVPPAVRAARARVAVALREL